MINLREGRKGFDSMGDLYPAAQDVVLEHTRIAGVPGAWFIPANLRTDKDIVIYIHGGAFIYGSVHSHAAMISHIALKLRRKVLMIDYKLAPEHRFPAGIEDNVAVIKALCSQHPGLSYGIIGDSAGGNLTMATQLRLRALNIPRPQYSIVTSPWVDLECKSRSYERNKVADTILAKEYLQEAAGMYAGNHALTDPLLSPVNADFQQLAPVLILCGTAEILEDDSVNLHRRLLECDVLTDLHLFKGELHVWPFMDISSTASQAALNRMEEFVVKYASQVA